MQPEEEKKVETAAPEPAKKKVPKLKKVEVHEEKEEKEKAKLTMDDILKDMIPDESTPLRKAFNDAKMTGEQEEAAWSIRYKDENIDVPGGSIILVTKTKGIICGLQSDLQGLCHKLLRVISEKGSSGVEVLEEIQIYLDGLIGARKQLTTEDPFDNFDPRKAADRVEKMLQNPLMSAELRSMGETLLKALRSIE